VTVVTDVVARLRADTSDFSRGFASATAQVKALETATLKSQSRIVASTATMSNAGIVLGNASARNAALYRSSLGSMAATTSVMGTAMRSNNTMVADSLGRVAMATEVSSARSIAAQARQRDSLGRFAASTAVAGTGASMFGRQIDGAAQSGRRFAPVISGLSAGLKVAGAVGGIALAGIGAAMIGVTMKGIQAGAAFEQLELAFHSAFEAMGRSKSEANEFIKSMQQFAAKTPFEFTGVISATRQLMTLGYAPEVVRDQMLPAIGDIASALGQGEEAINRVIVQLQQMASLDRPVSQDLRAISNAFPGFNAKAALAAELFGGDMKKMETAIEGGSVTGKQAMEALIRQMAKFPGAAGMMAKQATTMSGTLSTFKDVINMALVNGFKPAMPAITKAMNQLVPAVEKLVTGFGNAMGPVVANVIDTVVPAFIELADALSPVIGELVSGLAPILSSLLPVVGSLAQGVGGVLVAAMKALTPVIEALAPPVQMFLDVLAASLTPVIEALQPHLAALATGLGQILMALMPLLPAISDILVALLPATPAFTELAVATTEILNAVVPLIVVLARMAAFIAPVILKVQQMTSPMRLLATQASVASGAVSKAFKIIEKAVATAAYVWGASVSLMRTTWQGITKILAPVTAAISSAMDKVRSVQAKVTAWMEKTWQATGGRVVSYVKKAFGGVVDAIAGMIDRAVNAAFKFAQGMIDGLVRGVNAAMPSFVKDFVGWTNSAIATAGNAGAASAANAGAAVGDAFGTNVVNSAVSKMNQLQGKVNDVFKGYGPGGNLGPKPVVGQASAVASSFGTVAPPGAGGSAGGGGGGGGGKGGGAKDEELVKWYNSLEKLIKGVKQLAKGGLTDAEVKSIIARSKGVLEQFPKAQKEAFKKMIEALQSKDAKEVPKAIAEIAKKISGAMKNFNAAAKTQMNLVKRNFERFAELSLRAFDAETSRMSDAIRSNFATGSVMTDWASSAMPDFGAVFDVGDGGLADSLESSISSMRAGLSSALSGLFGSGGQMDMSMKAIQGRFNTAMKAIEKSRNDAIAAANKARETEYEAAQGRREALTPAEQAMRDMNEQANVENLQRNKMEAEAAVAAAQKIRNTKKRNEALQEAQRRLNDALRAIQMDALQRQAEEERKVREEEYREEISAADEKYNRAVEEADRLFQLATEKAQEEYDRQVEHNRRMEEEQVRNSEFLREDERKRLEDGLENLRAQLEKRKVNWTKFNKDLAAITGNPDYQKAMRNSGLTLGSEFAKGLTKSESDITKAIKRIAALVQKYLKLESPAEKGPLSSLDKWWKSFGDTLIDGFDERLFAKKLSKAVSSLPVNVGANSSMYKPGNGLVSIMPVSGGNAGAAPVTIQITVQGSVIQERDLAETVREELIKIGRRDGTIFGEIV
jgi:tape measure domain-containing protein